MLRERTRSYLKDHQMAQLTADSFSDSKLYSDFLGEKHKNNFFPSAPLFEGFNSKASESDSARSPTSPLDFQVFSNLCNPIRSPRSSQGGNLKTCFKNKVGLGIIDSPDFEAEHSGKVLRASDSKSIVFGIKALYSQSSIHAPKSLPKDVGIFPYTNARPSNIPRGSSDVKFEIGDSAFELESSRNLHSFPFGSRMMDSNLGRLPKGSSFLRSRSFVSEAGSVPTTEKDPKPSNSPGVKQIPRMGSIGSCNRLIGTIPPSEVELSEDYTCVTIHGPDPKVRHIFGDCILEYDDNNLTNFGNQKVDGDVIPPTIEISKASLYPANDFLKFCHSCSKSLVGEDIYMYRGEKAFCSCNCRLQEILMDEAMDKINKKGEDFGKSSNLQESSEVIWFIST